MKDMKTSRSHQSSKGHSWKHRLAATGALSAVIAVGATAMFLGFSPDARALAANAVGGDHAAMFQRMHGAQSHAQMHEHFDQVLSDAGVSQAQKQQIHATMKAALTDGHADMQRYHTGVGQLATLLTEDPIDDAAIAALAAEQDRLALATSRRLTDSVVAVARVLTPAQRVKLGADIERMMAAHRAQDRAD